MGSEVSRAQPNGENTKKHSSSSGNEAMKKMSRRMSMGTAPIKMSDQHNTPSIRVGGSTGMLTVSDNDCEMQCPQQQVSQSSRLSLSIDPIVPRSRSGSSSSQSPTKPSKNKCSLSLKNIQLIQGCFNNPHENIGFRILKRSAERRKDFGRFYSTVSLEQREQIADTIKILLKNSVNCLESSDEKFTFEDSTITECVLLDAAVHPAAVTLNAFSQFITMLFSSVRDGFYMEMRRLRRVSNSFSTISNAAGSHKKLSVEDAIKAAANSSLAAMGAGVRRSSTTKDGDGSYSRRGSGGSTSNNSLNATSSRSVSPADEGTSNKHDSSPFDGSSQEDNQRNNKNIVNGNRRSHSRSPSRKFSVATNSSGREPYRAKIESNALIPLENGSEEQQPRMTTAVAH
uniref:RGS domain-containing protein n=1 Tax=Meloidogyne hapla TaxID=6305 RepID=A0A1I8B9A4_MELHA